jgi:hypothetical protein
MNRETITAEKWLNIKSFCKKWITKVLATHHNHNTVKYREALLEELDRFIPEDDFYGAMDLLKVKNWDSSVSGMLLCDFFNYEYQAWSNLSKKGQDDFYCMIRIAIDLFVKQSGGVIGYNVSHILDVFKHDFDLIKSYGLDIDKTTNPNSPIWL